MNAQQFVANFKADKDMAMKLYFDGEPSEVSERIKALGLPPDKLTEIEGIVDVVLTDTYYSILMGLEGSASIGEDQQGYTIIDEGGTVITDSAHGDLGGYAWDAFQLDEDNN